MPTTETTAVKPTESADNRPFRAVAAPPLAALSVIGIGLAGLAFAVVTSGLQFTQSLEAALAAQTQPTTVDNGGRGSPAIAHSTPVSGSESYWLDSGRAANSIQPATWSGRTLAPGDRLQVAGGNTQRILEITDVRQLPAAPAAAASPGEKTPQALLLITLRDVQSPDAVPMRLLVDADAPLAGLAPLGRSQHRNL
ncbi:MAG: hypothetical protein KDJ47_01740 [Hyphomicrobiaceae bacterium]|nr:hypothetical protein [Hyphomicrobiaceae bacterium]